MADETITEAEIWEDIDKIFILPEREMGDIDVTQIMERYGVTETAARKKMKKLVSTGKWVYVKVHDTESGNGWRRVLREVSKNG